MTREWSDHQARQREFAERMQRDKAAGDEIVLMDGETAPRAYVYMDERGRPRLGLGDRSRLSADIDIDTDEQGFGLKYKLDWGEKKKLPPVPRVDGSPPAMP